MTIEYIDFSKLKPYDGQVTKCFEQLCYQIALREYGHLGKFTPIDGSGGDGGVEFYLDLPNGKQWGWQCKFYSDNGRLNQSSRDSSIEGSLETACRNHPGLERWFLCTKTDLTTDSLSKKGKFSKGERRWFDTELPKKVPAGRSVALEHWGESAFLYFFRDPKHLGIRSFFFGELEFNQSWFRKRFEENFVKVSEKYDPELHTIDDFTQSIIDFALLNKSYLDLLEKFERTLLAEADTFRSALKEFNEERFLTAEEEAQRHKYVATCQEFETHISLVFQTVGSIKCAFRDFSQAELTNFSLDKLNEDFFKCTEAINYHVFKEDSRTFREASSISYLINSFSEQYNQFFRNYLHSPQKDIHFLAGAGEGKTHLACHTAYTAIENGRPVLFLTGDKFTNQTTIGEALLKNLDIHPQYSLDDFLQALDVYGSIVKAKVPVVIDGLNETTCYRYFSPIWRDHLPSFCTKIAGYKHLVLVTTCRKSYKPDIWGETVKGTFYYLRGFANSEATQEAVVKYFKKYHLKADLSFSYLGKFSKPIFLKLYCEIKNPHWKHGVEKEVNLEEDSAYDLFNEYFKQINQRVNAENPFLRRNEPFITKSLAKLAAYLWQNNQREITVDEFYSLVDNGVPYKQGESRSDLLIHEGLVLTRDIRDSQEHVSLTYDLMAGHLIAKHLISTYETNYFSSGEEFWKRMRFSQERHPLYEDIGRSLALLYPQLKNASLRNILEVEQEERDADTDYKQQLWSESVTSLFELPARFIEQSDIDLIRRLFHNSDQNKEAFFNLLRKTITDTAHPLNAAFWSEELHRLPMNGRDITWTEYVRKHAAELDGYLDGFERGCRSLDKASSIEVQKAHLAARFIQWLLTSTNRSLRDKATRALYYYGRKFPEAFSELVFASLACNDPYVWERMLAAQYGVIMAEHNSFVSLGFRSSQLPVIARNLYNLIFKENAPYGTTHILARDYARRSIEVCLIHHPDLFTEEEIALLRPPYRFGGIRQWPDYPDEFNDHSRGPIRMDFGNYTIGGIVKGGTSYANTPQKRKVRGNIYWRIYDLGWNEDTFKQVEIAVGNDGYRSRGERAKIERYGKKYSWIAYYEVAGYRDDFGLLDKDWERFIISAADIDPSFPEAPSKVKIITNDSLGNREQPLVDWMQNGGVPDVNQYLKISDLLGNQGEWVCLDGFVVQEDLSAARERFTFIRGLLLKDKDYKKVRTLLQKQNLGGRWLPEKHGNYYTYAGELYYCSEATYSNFTKLEFAVGTKKIKIKKGHPGYFPEALWDHSEEGSGLLDETEVVVNRIKKINTLLPVMDYNWESYHSEMNKAGSQTVVAKEIARHLALIDLPQTFDLFDKDGKQATVITRFHEGTNNSQHLVYIRKDLFDKFLKDNGYRFIWAIWGERQAVFRNDAGRTEFYRKNAVKAPQVFQSILDY